MVEAEDETVPAAVPVAVAVGVVTGEVPSVAVDTTVALAVGVRRMEPEVVEVGVPMGEAVVLRVPTGVVVPVEVTVPVLEVMGVKEEEKEGEEEVDTESVRLTVVVTEPVRLCDALALPVNEPVAVPPATSPAARALRDSVAAAEALGPTVLDCTPEYEAVVLALGVGLALSVPLKDTEEEADTDKEPEGLPLTELQALQVMPLGEAEEVTVLPPPPPAPPSAGEGVPARREEGVARGVIDPSPPPSCPLRVGECEELSVR